MESEEKGDGEWVRTVQAGEVDAFGVLVRRHEKAIFNLLYRWLGDYDEAAEAAQEVFLSAFRSIGQFRGEASFSTWLHRIAVNQAKNRKRARIVRERGRVFEAIGDPERDGDVPANLPHPDPDPAEEAERNELQRRVQEGIDRLKDEEALIILLHDLQGFAYEEISKMLALPIGTVKSRLHRAREALKSRLAPYYDATKAER
ncbi:MAG TPA: sigma-70 family RNA polymerase sigma factor [Nitrospiria bacterium]|nr:sigma-70 family RNA polymerase sigma factor [Nitrospiria bacterium]